MYQFILLIHVFAAAIIIALVLIQQGKGAAVGAAFGSGASQTVFGSRGSGSFLFKVTMSLIAIFFATSIGLNYLAAHTYKQAQTISPVQSIPVAPVTPAKKEEVSSPSSVGTLPSLPVNEIPVRK